MGQIQDGAAPSETLDEGGGSAAGVSVKGAVKTMAFWFLFSIYVLQLLGLSSLNFHFMPFATQETKFTHGQAYFFYGLTVGFSILGRLFFGWLADRFRPSVLTAIAGFLLALGPLALWLVFIRSGSNNPLLFVLHALPYGVGIGANAVIVPVLVGRCFGERNFSKIAGLVMSGFAIGILVGIPGTAKIFDTTGSYEIAFIICIAAFVISAALALLIKPERYRGLFTTG